MDVEKMVEELVLNGYCCTEVFVRLGLQLKGLEDELFANASTGLCGGLKNGGVCGCLTGAAMMLTMFDKQASAALVTEIYAWFDETYGDKYGTINCEDILPNRSLKAQVCPPIMKETAKKCVELLAERGLLEE